MPLLRTLKSRPQPTYGTERSDAFLASTPGFVPSPTPGAGTMNVDVESPFRSRYLPQAFASVEELVAGDVEAFSQRHARVRLDQPPIS